MCLVCWEFMASRLKSIGLSKGTPGSSKITLSEGKEIIFENFKVANIFNNFFTSVAEKTG